MVIVKLVQLRTFSMPYPTETQQMEKVLVFNNIYESIDDFLSEDEMDQDPSWGEQHNSMEDINQSLDDSVIILDVDKEDNKRYTYTHIKKLLKSSKD